MPPPPHKRKAGEKEKVQQHLREISLFTPLRATFPTADQEVKAWIVSRESGGRLANAPPPLWRIGPFEAQGNNNGLRARRQLTAGDARESRTGPARSGSGQRRRVEPSRSASVERPVRRFPRCRRGTGTTWWTMWRTRGCRSTTRRRTSTGSISKPR